MTKSKKALSILAGLIIELISLAFFALSVLIIVPRLIVAFTMGDMAIVGVVAKIAIIAEQIGATMGLNALYSDLLFFLLPAVITQIIAVNYIYVKHKYKAGLATFGMIVSVLLLALVGGEVASCIYLLNLGAMYYLALVPFVLAVLLLLLYVFVGNGNKATLVTADSIEGDKNGEVVEGADEEATEEVAEQADTISEKTETAQPVMDNQAVTEELTEEPAEVTEELTEEPAEVVEENVVEEEVAEATTEEVEETTTVEEPVVEENVVEEEVTEPTTEEVEEPIVEEVAEPTVEESIEEEPAAIEEVVEQAPIIEETATEEPIEEVATQQAAEEVKPESPTELPATRKQLRKRVTAKQLDEVSRILKWQSNGYLTSDEGQTMINIIMYGEDK